MANYYAPIMQIILTKLQNQTAPSTKARFVRLYHFISAHSDTGMGADFFIKIMDQIQSGYVPSFPNVVQ